MQNDNFFSTDDIPTEYKILSFTRLIKQKKPEFKIQAFFFV